MKHVIMLVMVLGVSFCTSTIRANEAGFTDLHEAASQDDDYILTTFLEKGVPINAIVGEDNKKYKGFTPLHLAIFHNLKKNVEVLLQDPNINIEHIIANGGALYNEKDSLYGFTPLHLAAYLGNKEMVKLLLKNDAKEYATVDKKNKTFSSYTAYGIAKKMGNDDVVRWLQPKKALEEQKPEKTQKKPEKLNPGFNDLHQAVYEGDLEKVNKIFETFDKKNINVVVGRENEGYCGFTALHIAVKVEKLDIAKVLLENGVNINATIDNKNKLYAGMTALDMAKNKDLVNLLVLATVAVLLNAKNAKINNPINTKNPIIIGMTPLQFAALNGLIDIIEKLLKKGANVNKSVSDQNERYAGFSALHMAAISENGKAVIKTLLKNKANIGAVVSNNKKYKGFTAIHLAIVHGSFDNIEDYCGSLLDSMIADKDAKIDGNSLYGFRPLQLAGYLGKVYAVKELLKNGADAHATVHKDNAKFAGKTALDLAEIGKIKDLEVIENARQDEERIFGLDLASADEARNGDENLVSQKNYSKIIKMLKKTVEKKAAVGQT